MFAPGLVFEILPIEVTYSGGWMASDPSSWSLSNMETWTLLPDDDDVKRLDVLGTEHPPRV